MIYGLIYHAKRGPTKVSIDYLYKVFDVDNQNSLLLAMLKIRLVYNEGNKNYWIVEII